MLGNFMFFRMHRITDIYFVGGFGTVQWIDVDEYLGSAPDAIATNHPTRTLQVGMGRSGGGSVASEQGCRVQAALTGSFAQQAWACQANRLPHAVEVEALLVGATTTAPECKGVLCHCSKLQGKQVILMVTSCISVTLVRRQCRRRHWTRGLEATWRCHISGVSMFPTLPAFADVP